MNNFGSSWFVFSFQKTELLLRNRDRLYTNIEHNRLTSGDLLSNDRLASSVASHGGGCARGLMGGNTGLEGNSAVGRGGNRGGGGLTGGGGGLTGGGGWWGCLNL